MEQATLGGGCFWCLEAVYQMVEGVESVTSGYAAGRTKNPDYRSVCSGTTGHAEVIQISFDPKIISYSEILEVFWISHDPTTLNRQGNDIGTQYRSIILCHSKEQKIQAEESIRKTEGHFFRSNYNSSRRTERILSGRKLSSKLLQNQPRTVLLSLCD
ncbi:peptide-methionine (S)-S-oxide reductase [Leptospira interrogans serovar Copenhageni str. LT2050]|uniref:Peptide methionine sulfoxide reductase MsrA n=1 Tax=Leptospira interrogans serovar Copenhageni str. LT2050 TaxID=1001598 RepID=M3H4M9_LEPIT|nr:peptide-methionine (S)-S-oxide reductase [Leptospira interrogans serovar Copenhageni str. LT2050]